MLVWPNSILSSAKTHENTLGIYKKASKEPWLWEIIFSGLMNLNSKHRVWRKPALLITCRVSKVCCLMLWGCFSAAGTEGLVREEENLNAPKYRDSLSENPVQSIQNLRRAEGLPSNRTMNLNTRDAPIRIFATDAKYRFFVMVIGRYQCRFWCFKFM